MAGSVMRSKSGAVTQQQLLARHSAGLTDVLDALNVLGATAWRVNGRVCVVCIAPHGALAAGRVYVVCIVR
jgi:DNA-directed RNA polymerase